jgi:hypothetical protein
MKWFCLRRSLKWTQVQTHSIFLITKNQLTLLAAVISDVKQEVKNDGEVSVFVRAAKVKEASKAKSSTQLPNFGEWTEWSSCDRTNDGRRARYRRCPKENVRECPVETQWCNRQSIPRKQHSPSAIPQKSTVFCSFRQCTQSRRTKLCANFQRFRNRHE